YITAFICFAVLLAVLWAGYTVLGHRAIGILYDRGDDGLLGIITGTGAGHPLEFYLRNADFIFYEKLFPVVAFTPPFFMLVFWLYSYLFGQVSPVPVPTIRGGGEYRVLLVTALYLVLTVLFYFPVIKLLNGSIIGPPGDNLQHFWDMWWMRKVMLEHDGSLMFTRYIMYPQGTPLLYHAFSFYNMVLATVLNPLLTRTILYNLLMLHTYVLAGIGAFLLIRYLTKDNYVALIGSFIFAFSPFHFGHSLYHIESASIQFIPFFVLFFIKAIREGSKRDLFLACLFYFLISVCSWYFMIFTAYFMAFGYVYLAIRRKKLFMPDVLLKIIVIGGVTLIVLSPWLVKMILMGIKYPSVRRAGHNFYVADALSFFTPGTYNWLGDMPWAEWLNERFTGNRVEKIAYLGIVNILVVIAAFKGIVRKSAKYFCGFIAFSILSMGAYLHVAGTITPVVLPYRILQYIPFLSHARVPSRCMVYAYLFWGIIAGYGAKYLFEKIKRPIIRTVVAGTLVIAVFFDFFSICQDTVKVYQPDCYNAIKKEEGFGILDLPSHLPVDAIPVFKYMMYQTFHGIPIVQGVIARTTADTLISRLDEIDISMQKRQLAENCVKYVVIHKNFITPFNPLDIDKYKRTYDVVWEDDDNVVLRAY
ncbi:MAG: hypothetical protein WBD00_04735, partial [Candidatus Omnitrophota bacterium]